MGEGGRRPGEGMMLAGLREDVNQTHFRETMFVMTLALTFYPLPQERKSPLHDSGFTNNPPANPAAGFAKDMGNVKALSLGRGLGEGGRETIG